MAHDAVGRVEAVGGLLGHQRHELGPALVVGEPPVPAALVVRRVPRAPRGTW